MSTSGRQKALYHHGDLAGEVLQIAGELIENKGVEALRMRDLARRARVSHSAPYRHYPDRERLLVALAAEGFAMLGRAQQAARAAGDLRAMGAAYVAFALAHPQRFRLMFGGAVRIARDPMLRETAARVFDGLAGALEGQLRSGSARDASVAAWALVHGLAQLLLDDKISAAARGGRDPVSFARDVLSAIRFVVRPGAGPDQSG
jgi:AcrR family transcriptional regulator